MSLTARPQLARRVQFVLSGLLETCRWPDVTTLPQALPGLAGAVLREHPLTKPDRAAPMKVAGAAATYCWEFLPELEWEWAPETLTVPEDTARPLAWRGLDGQLVVDVLLTGLHRDPHTSARRIVTEVFTAAAAEALPLLGLRVLPLAAPARALAFTAPDEPTRLAGSALDIPSGVWR